MRAAEMKTRRKPVKGSFVLLISMAMVLAASCSAAGPTGADAATMAQVPLAPIYAAVVRHLIALDGLFCTASDPAIYILERTNDQVGEGPAAGSPTGATPPEAMQSMIASALDDLPARIRWVASRQDVQLAPQTGRVSGGGVIISLGNVDFRADGTAFVLGIRYQTPEAAEGETLVLERASGRWAVNGDRGRLRISW
jgi:hypothetical protein